MPDRPAQQLLRALHERATSVPDNVDWEAVVAIALNQGVAPLLHRRLCAVAALTRLPARLADALAAERRATALTNLGNYAEFRRIKSALDASGIPALPLKGLHLAELAYRDISLRPMADLDILVPRERVADAIRALRAEGYGHDEELGAAVEGLLDVKCNIGLAQAARHAWLEVHWRLDESPADSTRLLQAIWRGARTARLGDMDVKVMPAEFLLLHVCAHLACNHAFAFSLRALCDIAEIIREHTDLDWKTIVEHGRQHGWTRGVAASMRLARDHLGVPIPPEALAALGGETLEAEMLDEAMSHLFGTQHLPEGLASGPRLLALSGAGKPWEKLGLLLRRIFVPRAELALLYGVPANAPGLPLYYAVRLRDLLRRYSSTAWALHAGDPALGATAARHVRLTRWIRGDL